ncbi:MAG: shikimate kinase [Actinomycetota bacterium]
MSTPPPPQLAQNIVLTGFMGTGKTTVGRILAERLDRTFVDSDEIIEERFGPIPKIFERLGEEAFRDMERQVAASLAATSGMVIATGGRLMLDRAAADALSARARVFCLAADVDTLVERLVSEAGDRPLLADTDVEQRIRALLESRQEGYGRFEQVATTGRSPEQVADDITERLAG